MSRNARIAKNTAYLYFRMLLIMGVQFFTVRVTLKYLGVVDYGIYNVVCGVTNIFTFLTHTMTSASQRFLAFDMGRNDEVRLKQMFDTLVALFSIGGFVAVALLAIGGFWFIENHLVIPADRIDAALFAFLFTIIALYVSVVVLPYNSLIVAHEDMKAFAYVSILDAVLKLAIVYCLVITPFDRLKTYALLMFAAYLLPAAITVLFCFRKYSEVTIKWNVDWSLSRKVLPFMSWNLLGGISWMLCTQGLSILINLFFGPIANAAKAIADKVNGAVNGFSNNFMMAVQPQVVKLYAADNLVEMHKMFYMASKLSFFLMLVIVLPVVFNADGLLDLWLVNHDSLTTYMLQCVLLYSFISSLEIPINQAIRATGNIRDYQIYTSLLTFMVIPVAYIFFKSGLPAYFGYIALIIVYGMAFIARLYYLRKQIRITYSMYLKNVFAKCFICFVVTSVILYVITAICKQVNVHSLFAWSTCVVLSSMVLILMGLSRNERIYTLQCMKNLIHKKK